MSFPTGGPGYPQQGGGAQPNPPGPGGHPHPRSGGLANLSLILAIVVAALGLVSYFLGFSGDVDGLAIVLLLAGGLVSAAALLPQAPKVQLWATILSTLGGLAALSDLITAERAPGVLVVVMLLGVIQMAASIVALLFDQNIVKMPTGGPRPQYPAYGQPGPYGGQGQQQGGGFQPPAATPQSTVYAPQQGQFYQPEPGQQANPGTPPGGFGGQS